MFSSDCPVRSRLAKLLTTAAPPQQQQQAVQALMEKGASQLIGNDKNKSGGAGNLLPLGAGVGAAVAALFGYRAMRMNNNTNNNNDDCNNDGNGTEDNSNINDEKRKTCPASPTSRRTAATKASSPTARDAVNNGKVKNNVDLPQQQQQKGGNNNNLLKHNSALAVPNSLKKKQEEERLRQLPNPDAVLQDDRLVEACPLLHPSDDEGEGQQAKLNAIAAAEAVCNLMDREDHQRRNKSRRAEENGDDDEGGNKGQHRTVPAKHQKNCHQQQQQQQDPDHHPTTQRGKKLVTFAAASRHHSRRPQGEMNGGNNNNNNSNSSSSNNPRVITITNKQTNKSKTTLLPDISASPWMKLSILGTGSDGVLYKVMHRDTGAVCCMKELLRTANDKSCSSMVRELEVLAKVHDQHPNLIAIRSVEYIRPQKRNGRMLKMTVATPNTRAKANNDCDDNSTSSDAEGDDDDEKNEHYDGNNNNKNNNTNDNTNNYSCKSNNSVPHFENNRDHHNDLISCRVVFEYCCLGTLNRLQADVGVIHEPLLRSYAKQLLSALQCLHSNNTIHRDIIPQNIMVDQHGHLKLAGFGRARFTETMFPTSPIGNIDDNNINTNTNTSNNNNNDGGDRNRRGNNSNTTKRLAGHVLFFAPESIRGNFSPASDLWTLGATLVQLSSGYLPWHSRLLAMANNASSRDSSSDSPLLPTQSQQQRQQDLAIFSVLDDVFGVMNMICSIPPADQPEMRQNHHPDIPPHLSAECQQFLKTLFHLNPKERKSAKELLETDVWLLNN